MFENIMRFFKKANKKEALNASSKEKAKERLHLVLMQDRANVSADFLDLMRQEIIEVIKKYIDIDESAMDVRLTNQANEDGTQGAPALYANIPIINIKDKTKKAKKEIENLRKEKEEKKIEEDKSIKEEKIEENRKNINEEKENKKNEHEDDKKENLSNNKDKITSNNEEQKNKVEQENSTIMKNNTKKESENE